MLGQDHQKSTVKMVHTLLNCHKTIWMGMKFDFSAQELIALKGYTSTGVGMAVADLIEAIVYNKNKIICVSTLVKVG